MLRKTDSIRRALPICFFLEAVGVGQLSFTPFIWRSNTRVADSFDQGPRTGGQLPGLFNGLSLGRQDCAGSLGVCLSHSVVSLFSSLHKQLGSRGGASIHNFPHRFHAIRADTENLCHFLWRGYRIANGMRTHRLEYKPPCV
jgi:hypothetical protein